MIPISRDGILAAFRAHKNRPLKAVDISRFLEQPADDRGELRALLRALVEDGDLVRVEGRRFALAGHGDVHEGGVRLSGKGYGWFTPDTVGEGDAFIPPPETDELIDGDRVRARIEPSGKGPVARIQRVLSRGRTSVTGVYRRSTRGVAAEVDVSPGVMRHPLLLEVREGDPVAADGDLVEATIVRYPTPVRSALGHVVRVLGKAGSIRAEVERILEDHQVIRAFSVEALAQAEKLGDAPSTEDTRGREDLRKMPLCTIDGETAKDFDDAVFAAPHGKDIEVRVAIADVAHYVAEGSPLDEDAIERGTSLYYPGRVVPMLPEALSNGLCSLKPKVERLCMTVRFLVDEQGLTRGFKFSNAVMRSHARLTYKSVAAHFDGDELDVDLGVKTSLTYLRTAAKRLGHRRRERGTLDFNLAEAVFQIDDDGNPVASVRAPRNEAHKLIEELMIAANETVAEHFFSKDLPCIYRVHEPPNPEKLERFFGFAKQVALEQSGRNLGKALPATAKDVGKLTEALGDTPLREALDSLLLRAMMQAHYGAENLGHFSLASTAYLHFTSPIRRYPDLAVHRQLKAYLARQQKGKKKLSIERREKLYAELDAVAKAMSDREREAMACERDISSLMATWLLRKREGEQLEGRVTAVTDFGAFIKVEPLHVDGLVPIGDISRDYLALDQHGMRLVADRSGFSLGVGDRVTIEVVSANLTRRQTVFRLVQVTEQRGRPVQITPTQRQSRQNRGEAGHNKAGHKKSGHKKRGAKKNGVDRSSRRRRDR